MGVPPSKPFPLIWEWFPICIGRWCLAYQVNDTYRFLDGSIWFETRWRHRVSLFEKKNEGLAMHENSFIYKLFHVSIRIPMTSSSHAWSYDRIKPTHPFSVSESALHRTVIPNMIHTYYKVIRSKQNAHAKNGAKYFMSVSLYIVTGKGCIRRRIVCWLMVDRRKEKGIHSFSYLTVMLP